MANEYKIASFNAWNLSFNASVDKLAYIADIIKNGDFDIVGVQEVFTEGNTWGGASVESDINKRFLKYNLPGWECRYCKPSKENSRTADVRGEGFFLIWKTSSFKLAEYKEINNPEVRIFEPRIINELSNDTYKDIPPMARMPMYARFVATNNSQIELRIINVHLFEGGKTQDGFSGRQEEFWTTINEIYSGVQNRVYGAGVKPYTIILGDYNLIIDDDMAYKAAILDRFSPYIERVNTNDNGVNIITRQSKPSTISSPYIDEDGNEKMPDDPYKNNYDHFSYDMDRFKSNDVQVEVRRIDMDECIEEEPKKYETKELEYRKIVSDHVPVVMTITF